MILLTLVLFTYQEAVLSPVLPDVYTISAAHRHPSKHIVFLSLYFQREQTLPRECKELAEHIRLSLFQFHPPPPFPLELELN